ELAREERLPARPLAPALDGVAPQAGDDLRQLLGGALVLVVAGAALDEVRAHDRQGLVDGLERHGYARFSSCGRSSGPRIASRRRYRASWRSLRSPRALATRRAASSARWRCCMSGSSFGSAAMARSSSSQTTAACRRTATLTSAIDGRSSGARSSIIR